MVSLKKKTHTIKYKHTHTHTHTIIGTYMRYYTLYFKLPTHPRGEFRRHIPTYNNNVIMFFLSRSSVVFTIHGRIR